MLDLLASSTNDAGPSGLLIIAGVLVLIVIAVGAVWTFAARRGSRVPERRDQRPDHGVRDH
jgi:hypothetical protein